MAKKPTPAAAHPDDVVALTAICIDGVAFAAGDEITGVDPEQVAIAVRVGRAGPRPEVPAQPEPELDI